VSTTKIQKVQTSLEQWSLESGMSKKSFEGGLSFPIGKASVGAKFGFERERSHSSKTTSETSETRYTALHTIPAVQINLNETTVLLSPDAEFDIKKLRRERKFTDLLSFFDKYGSFSIVRAKAYADGYRHAGIPERYTRWTSVSYPVFLFGRTGYGIRDIEAFQDLR
jgi:hypothetical protein